MFPCCNSQIELSFFGGGFWITQHVTFPQEIEYWQWQIHQSFPGEKQQSTGWILWLAMCGLGLLFGYYYTMEVSL